MRNELFEQASQGRMVIGQQLKFSNTICAATVSTTKLNSLQRLRVFPTAISKKKNSWYYYIVSDGMFITNRYSFHPL